MVYAQNNINLSTEILYLSQTRFVDKLGNRQLRLNNNSDLTIQKIAQSGQEHRNPEINSTKLSENIQILQSTVESAKTGLTELNDSYSRATRNLKQYIHSEEGSTAKKQALENINETKNSINEILQELKTIENEYSLTDIEKTIHSIVKQAVQSAERTFSSLDLEDNNDTLKGYYLFQMDQNNLKGRVNQLNAIEDELRKSSANVFALNSNNQQQIPFFGFDSNLIHNDYMQSNNNNPDVLLNLLNVNQRTAGRLFSYTS